VTIVCSSKIDSSRVPGKWLLLELKNKSELEDSLSMGQENQIYSREIVVTDIQTV
jgi:hypothetical protein